MQGRKTIRNSLTLLTALSFLALTNVQCRHDGLNVSALKPVCFDTEIAPIFLNKCATCHGQGDNRGGLRLNDYTTILKSVIPFNAQKSKAYLAITGKGFTQLMPPDGALSENERILIRVWIDQGAKNTVCYTPPSVDTTGNGGGGSTFGGSGSQVCFQRDILPVLLSSCGTKGCHDQTTHAEGYTITSYSSVMTKLVKAGSPSTSRLYTSIANNSMPRGSIAKLTQAVKDSVYNWIKNGAIDGTCASACDTTGVVTYAKQISSLVNRNCISCHSGASAQKGILLDSYANIKTYMDNGKLMAAVKGTSIPMPQGYKITDCEMRQLELWVANGLIQN